MRTYIVTERMDGHVLKLKPTWDEAEQWVEESSLWERDQVRITSARVPERE